MPLGDSRVEGGRPDYESYRYELWRNLIENGWEFDFIGTRTDDAGYPAFLTQEFDTDHEGTGGAESKDILTELEDVLSCQGSPDVVLLGIGGNDFLAGSSVADVIQNINEIVDLLQTNNDSVTIFLEQIAPGVTSFMTPALTTTLTDFNTAIADVATSQTTGISRVIAVDMEIDWSDDYMADEIHYNEAGAKVVADRYYDGIQEFVVK